VSEKHEHDEGAEHFEPYFDRRDILRSTSHLALGGVLGSLLAAAEGCRAPQIYRDSPTGVPTGYIIDPAKCTHNEDCQRVCPCGAVGFEGEAKDGEGPECRTCYINLDKCCACGRCFRVCPDDAIVPCYGVDKIPAREIGRAPKKD
jgi:ferredoxin